jgi:hypothetical protein
MHVTRVAAAIVAVAALAAASLAPRRVQAVVLLVSVGPGCVNGWDKLLAAPAPGRCARWWRSG